MISACSVTVIDLRHRCTRDDPTFRHRGVLLFAACAHHSSSGCGVISTGMGAGAGAGSAAGGSSGQHLDEGSRIGNEFDAAVACRVGAREQ